MRASHAPPQGGGSQRSEFYGFLAIYAYTLCRRIAKFDITYGEGLVLGGSLLGGSHALPSRGRSLVLGYAGCRLVAKIIETLLSLLAGQKQLKKLTVHQWIVFCHMTSVYYIRRARLIIVATFFNTYDEVYVYTAR